MTMQYHSLEQEIAPMSQSEIQAIRRLDHSRLGKASSGLRRLCIASLCLCIAGLFNPCGARERTYRYELELSQDDRVCRHMLEVYNTKFREPWNQQKFPQTKLEDIFPRLPGIEYNKWWI